MLVQHLLIIYGVHFRDIYESCQFNKSIYCSRIFRKVDKTLANSTGTPGIQPLASSTVASNVCYACLSSTSGAVCGLVSKSCPNESINCEEGNGKPPHNIHFPRKNSEPCIQFLLRSKSSVQCGYVVNEAPCYLCESSRVALPRLSAL